MLWFKILILILLALIVLSLGAGLFFLAEDRGKTRRTLTALSFRISISVALFVLLIVGYLTGMIQPHGVAG